MSFLNPWLLLGTLGIAVPILIHLLNRFRYRRSDWAAMELLRRAVLTRSRRIRIEDLILLVLRCAAVALAAIALARPTLSARGAKGLGGETRVGAVIAIDGSFSMAARPGVRSRFERAREIARAIQGALRPGDSLSLVLLGREPRILLRNVTYGEDRFEEAIRRAEPLDERLDLEASLDGLVELAAEMKSPVRECYIVTDAQRVSWSDLSAKARRSIEEIGANATIFILPAPPDGAENVAIEEFSLVSGALRRGSTARFMAQIRNFGATPREGVAVRLFLGDQAVDRRAVDRIAPGERAEIPLYVHFEEAGIARLTAKLDPDAVAADDVRRAVAVIPDRVRVLCIDGDPSDRPERSETYFVRAALSPKPGAMATASVETISWLDGPAATLAGHEIVVLANVPDLREAQVAALDAFVAAGGGAIISLGPKVDAGLLAERMRRGEGSLLPAEPVEIISAPAEAGWSIEPAAGDHTIARAIRSLSPELVAEARIRRAFGLRLLPGGRVIANLAGTGMPVIVEREIGRGRLILIGTTADREWTDLPSHPLFPILIHESVTALTRRPFERPLLAGDPLRVGLPDGAGERVRFRDPTGEEDIVRVAADETGRFAARGSAPHPGFYDVATEEGADLLAVAVNVDPAESDIAPLAREALREAAFGLPVRIPDEGEDIAAVIRESRIGREIWRSLMIAALALLVLESFLARMWSRNVAVANVPSVRGRVGVMVP